VATPNAGVLDTVLNTFRSQIDTGIGALTGPVQGSLGALIVISVAGMAIFWAIDETNNIFGPLFRKILVVGFWAYMILNWQTLALAAFSLFGKLGIAAGGGGGGLSDFLNNPSLVVKNGLTNATALWDFGNYTLGATNGWGTPPPANPIDIGAAMRRLFMALEIMLSCAVMIVAYAWLALEIVVTVIEFHIVILIAFITLPFGVLAQTTSLAERSIAYVFSAGFKVMALGIVIAIGTATLNQYLLVEAPASAPTTETLMVLPMVVVLILMLALHAPKYAAAVVSGAATTGAGNFFGAAAGVGAGILAAGGAVLAAGKGAAALSGRAGAGSVAAAGAASGAPSSTTTGSPMPPRSETSAPGAQGEGTASGASTTAASSRSSPPPSTAQDTAPISSSVGSTDAGSSASPAPPPASPITPPLSPIRAAQAAAEGGLPPTASRSSSPGAPGVASTEASRDAAIDTAASAGIASAAERPATPAVTEATRDAEIDAASNAASQAVDDTSHAASLAPPPASPITTATKALGVQRTVRRLKRAGRDLDQPITEAAAPPPPPPPPTTPPEETED
jgi:type IV secretion system protein TrbL